MLADADKVHFNLPITWHDCASLAISTTRPYLDSHTKYTHDVAAYLLFLSQHRNYTPMLIFLQNREVLFTITTRETQRFAKILHIGQGNGIHDEIFISVLIGLMFGQNSALGLDTDLRDPDEGHLDILEYTLIS